jgi:hypothetical protein
MSGPERPDGRLLALEAGLQRELGKLARLIDEVRAANALLATRPPSSLELRGAADLGHDWYTGLEKCFEQIANAIDGGTPAGPRWHRELLMQMGDALLPLRPAVISRDAQEGIGDYLRFRHLFRSLYGFELQWDRVRPLLEALPALHARVSEELGAFCAFLRAAAGGQL